MRYIIGFSPNIPGKVQIVKLSTSKNNGKPFFTKFRVAKKRANRILNDFLKMQKNCCHCEDCRNGIFED